MKLLDELLNRIVKLYEKNNFTEICNILQKNKILSDSEIIIFINVFIPNLVDISKIPQQQKEYNSLNVNQQKQIKLRKQQDINTFNKKANKFCKELNTTVQNIILVKILNKYTILSSEINKLLLNGGKKNLYK